MSEGEQQRTLKVVARRNKMRMGTLEQGDIVCHFLCSFWLLCCPVPSSFAHSLMLRVFGADGRSGPTQKCTLRTEVRQ